MKATSEFLLTNLTISTDTISQPYFYLEKFFFEYHLPETKRMLGRLLSAIYLHGENKSIYTKGLLYYYERLIMLIEVCWLINDMNNKEKDANIMIDYTHQGKLMEFSLFLRKTHEFLAWDYFPRDVTVKEYLRPYKALRKFFNYQSLTKWKEDLNTLLHNALSPHPSPISTEEMNLYRIPLLLRRLLDACYLIMVRELDPPFKN